MIRSLRIFFLSRLLREKLLLVAFIAIGAVIWLTGFSSRFSAWWRRQALTSQELRTQDRWLRDKPMIEENAQKAAAQLDPAKTLDGTRLFTTIRQLANDAGLRNISNDGLAPQGATGQFTVNTLTITARAMDPDPAKNWDAVLRFYRSVQQRSPYIAIDQLILQPQSRANPGQLTLVLRVSAVQIH
jgi:hypothetical protein